MIQKKFLCEDLKTAEETIPQISLILSETPHNAKHGCRSLRYKPFPCRKHLRFRVFCDAGKKTEIEDRFECAKIAAERVKDDPERKVGYYVTE